MTFDTINRTLAKMLAKRSAGVWVWSLGSVYSQAWLFAMEVLKEEVLYCNSWEPWAIEGSYCSENKS